MRPAPLVLNTRDAAAWLRLSPGTVTFNVKTGRMPAIDLNAGMGANRKLAIPAAWLPLYRHLRSGGRLPDVQPEDAAVVGQPELITISRVGDLLGVGRAKASDIVRVWGLRLVDGKVRRDDLTDYLAELMASAAASWNAGRDG